MNVTTLRNVGMNKGSPRIWLEGNKLDASGFTANVRYTVTIKREVIELTLAIDGEKKVSSKKTDDPLYRVPVIDMHNQGIGEFLGECKQVNVTYKTGLIIVRRIHVDAPQVTTAAQVAPVVAVVAPQPVPVHTPSGSMPRHAPQQLSMFD